AATTASAPSRICSMSGSGSPSPSADRRSRCKWRVIANGTPLATLIVSNTPSPTTRPWSNTDTLASSSGNNSPFIHTVTNPDASRSADEVRVQRGDSLAQTAAGRARSRTQIGHQPLDRHDLAADLAVDVHR